MPTVTTAATERNQAGAAQVIGKDVAYRYLILPLDRKGKTLFVAMAQADMAVLAEVQSLTRSEVVVHEVLPPDRIREGLRALYPGGERSFTLAGGQQFDETARAMLGMLVESAISLHSSDIHIEPTATGGRARLRVDRSLRLNKTYDEGQLASIIAVIKHDSNLRIDTRREFQDGSFALETANGRKVDLRVSIIPVDGREKAVLRLLGSYATLRAFEDTGMPVGLRQRYQDALSAPSGVHLIVGPTGSGKTTTAFSILASADSSKNIMTIEDPVEIRLGNNAYQVSVDERNGVTFASAMRAFVRQDPDIILCGELRDEDTAQETMNAGLQGRMVYSTCHSPDAIRVVDRLIEFGVRRSTIGSALRSVLAQRIVRRLCDYCKSPIAVEFALKRRFAAQFDGVRRIFEKNGKGCKQCEFTGIAGALAVFELFCITEQIEDAVVHEASRASLHSLALSEGYVPMREHGAFLIAEGLTSLAEVQEALSLEITTHVA